MLRNTEAPLLKSIRVLQLGSPTGLYGAERWILALVKHLDPQTVESWVAVIKDAPDLEAPLCREAQLAGIKTHYFEAHGKINLSVIRQVRQFIRDEKIDILHTHFYKTDLIGLLATIGTQCKIITTPHGWSKECDFKLYCYEMLDRCIFPFLNAVVPLSDEIFTSLRPLSRFGRQLCLIHNGVDISEIDIACTIAFPLQKWKVEGAIIVGYIGRLINGKGLEDLFYAACLLKTTNWRIAIVGEGPSQEKLMALTASLAIDNRVHFFGYQRARLAFLRGFDLFVLPSKSEGIPRCLMEAMAASVPVVASDIHGCRVLVTDNQTGLLFSPGSPVQLATQIDRLIENSELAKTLAEAARQMIVERFSAARMANEYEILYRGLAEGGGGEATQLC